MKLIKSVFQNVLYQFRPDAGKTAELLQGDKLIRLFVEELLNRPVKFTGVPVFTAGDGTDVFAVQHHPVICHDFFFHF